TVIAAGFDDTVTAAQQRRGSGQIASASASPSLPASAAASRQGNEARPVSGARPPAARQESRPATPGVRPTGPQGGLPLARPGQSAAPVGARRPLPVDELDDDLDIPDFMKD
ncbi:MAG: hypothetical protein ABI206_05745, partial [Antricoccus sp.]